MYAYPFDSTMVLFYIVETCSNCNSMTGIRVAVGAKIPLVRCQVWKSVERIFPDLKLLVRLTILELGICEWGIRLFIPRFNEKQSLILHSVRPKKLTSCLWEGANAMILCRMWEWTWPTFPHFRMPRFPPFCLSIGRMKSSWEIRCPRLAWRCEWAEIHIC